MFKEIKMQLIKSILRKFFSCTISLTIRLCRNEKVMLDIFSRSFEKYSDNYFCYKLRPKKADYFIPSNIKTTTTSGEFAIVLQGLIEMRDEFTFETIKLYRRLFPGAIIIVSTWDYTDPSIVRTLELLGCEVVLNKDIPVCGLGNVNYQICTSLAGLKRAKELGAEFALKNRSDLRVYREFAFEYLKSLVELNTISSSNVYGLKGRIITQAGNWGQMFNPMWLQDFLYFGYTDDLINLFDIPYDDRNIHCYRKDNFDTKRVLTGETLAKWPASEINITKRFIQKYHNSDLSLKDWWNFLGEYCYIVDSEDLLTLWNKYGLNDLGQFYCEYDGKHNYRDPFRHISSSDFINIMNHKYIYEEWMENEKANYTIE